MPRQSHGRSLHPATAKSYKKRPNRSNALNALEVAERENPENTKIRQNRLGEVDDDSYGLQNQTDIDGRSSKRRKVNESRTDERDDNGPVSNGDAIESGSDDEGGRWHEGVDGSEEDSDIDSDEAFGESDEERFAHFTFRGSEPTKSRPERPKASVKRNTTSMLDLIEDDEWQDAADFNNEGNEDHGTMLSEDDEEEDDEDDDAESDDLGNEAVDLATALEMNLEEEEKEAEHRSKSVRKQSSSKQTRAPVLEHEFSTEDDETDESSDLTVSDEEDDGDFAGLQSFVANLEAADNPLVSKPVGKSRALPSKASSFGIGSSKISASELLQHIRDPALRQSLKIIEAGERNGTEDYKGGIPGKLSAPLAKRQQDKLDRAAAFDKSKETLNRWVDTVKANRRAEHLSFPLVDPALQGAKSSTKLSQTMSAGPQTDLEATIQHILEESGIKSGNAEQLEDDETAFEQLQEKSIPLEELRERRAQLRLARELMFREERRAKRIKKIKSKAYRRVHRKERDKIEAQQREQLAAAGLIDSDEEREKNDRRRAEERMGARHKESKWAKGVKQIGRGAWDEDARLAVSDLARRDEELRRRVDGKHGHDSETSDSASDSDLVDSDVEGSKIDNALNALGGSQEKPSRLGSMLFMQRAEASQKARNDQEIREIRQAINGDAPDSSSGEDQEAGIVGRQRFGMNHIQSKPSRRKSDDFEAFLSEDEPDDTMNGEASVEETGLKSVVQSSVAKKKHDTSTSDGEPTRLGTGRLMKSVKSVVAPEKTSSAVHPLGKATSRTLDDYTSSSESETEALTPPNADDAKTALAAAIFAGPDDAVREFEQEKLRVIKEDDDQVVDNTLPGWGSWTGSGVSKREQKKGKGRFLTTIKGIAADKRQDAKLDKVIINEKRIKKNGKYLATELPHPFETRQQYERSLRLPMGPEWSTVRHFQDAIKPRILLKQGTVIAPMAKPTI